MEPTNQPAEKILEQKVEQNERNMKNAFMQGMGIIIGVSILTFIVPYITNLFFHINTGWLPWLLPIILLLTTFMVLYVIWGKHDVHCFFLREGYCLSLEVGGEVTAFLMKKTGYCFGPNWEVVEKTKRWEAHLDYEKWNPTRLKIFGLYILLNPFEYVNHMPRIWWKAVDKKPVKRIEVIKRLSLNLYPFYEKSDNAEDIKKGQIDNDAAIEGTITNPFTVMYRVNNWADFKSSYINAAMVGYFKTKTIDQIVEDPEPIGNQIFNFMKGVIPVDPKVCEQLGDSEIRKKLCDDNTTDFLKKMKTVFGFKISQVLNFNFEGGDEETKKAMKEMSIRGLQLDAEKINASIEAYKIFGPFWANLSVLTGKDSASLQEEYRGKPEEFEKKYNSMLSRAYVLTRERMEMKSGALSRHIFDGLGGSSKDGDSIKALIALATARLGDENGVSSKKAGKKKDNEEECPYE
jgi:hypothetical protein